MIKVCLSCKKQFNAVHTRNKFCSHKCRWIFMGNRQHKKCLVCGKDFSVKSSVVKNGDGKFCSRKCFGKWWSKNKKGEKSSNWRGGKIKRTCQICGKEFRIYPSELKYKKAKYCSYKCLGIAVEGEKSVCWLGGKSFEPYTVDWTETLRRAIRERDRYLCQLCDSYGNIVHHIDYDKKNSNPNNLVTLCLHCHSKTNHHRKYWKEYFMNS